MKVFLLENVCRRLPCTPLLVDQGRSPSYGFGFCRNASFLRFSEKQQVRRQSVRKEVVEIAGVGSACSALLFGLS